MDFHGFPQDFGSANKNFETSKTITSSILKIGHLIKEPNKLDKSDFLSFFINNTSLLIALLIGYCLTKLLIYLYFVFFEEQFNFLALFSINLRERPKLSKISIVILFFNLFLLIVLSLLSNSIKTEKLIVKTDKFIDSFDELDKTSKILTLFGSQTRNFKNAQYSSFIQQFYEKKRKKNELFFISSKNFNQFIELQNKLLNGPTDYLFFMDEIRLLSTVRSFTAGLSDKNLFLWLKPTLLYEEPNCFYLNPTLNKKKKQILHFR